MSAAGELMNSRRVDAPSRIGTGSVWRPELRTVADGDLTSVVRCRLRALGVALPFAVVGLAVGRARLLAPGVLFAVALVFPVPAALGQVNSSDCSYSGPQEFSTYGTYQNGVVYADRGQGGGSTGQAAVSGGACVDLEGAGMLLGDRLDGGTVEVGGRPDAGQAYGVFDGDEQNQLPLPWPYNDLAAGYFGVSNFESGATDPSCDWDAPSGSGSNSGGCFTSPGSGLPDVAQALPLPLLVCDHPGRWGSESSEWRSSSRDGCEVWLTWNWGFSPPFGPPAGSGPDGQGVEERESRDGDVESSGGAAPAAPASAASAGAPEAPLASPLGGGPLGLGLDPLGEGVQEPVTVVEQPASSQLPMFVNTAGSPGWFGSNLTSTGAANGRRSTVAIGGEKVFVTASNGAGSGRVEVYDGRTLARERVIAPPTQGWSSSELPLALGYYRGGLFVGVGKDCCAGAGGAELATAQGRPYIESVLVFDAQTGAFRRSFPLLVPGARTIDLAWGELWAAGPNATADGRDDYLASNPVSVYDAQTGALKGTSAHALTSRAADLGMSDPNNTGRSPVADDISLAPELGGGFVGAKLFRRAAFGTGASEATECGLPLVGDDARTDAECMLGGNTDAVWGMRWLLEAVTPRPNPWDYCAVREYRIGQAARSGALYIAPHLPGEYLTRAREWKPQQCAYPAKTLTDVAYNQREARIDIWGPLAGTDWLRLDKCVNYAVSDADIYVFADRGERWLEPARNFEKVDLYIDGQLRQTKTGIQNAIGSFCEATTSILNGPGHELKLVATVAGKQLEAINPHLNIDNANPTGTLTSLGEFVRGNVTITGTATDAHSGPKTWELEAQPAGGAWQRACGPVTQPDPTGTYGCSWNTANGQYPDGSYNLRAKITDQSSDGGNTAYTPLTATTVDNTPPEIDNMTPDLYEDAYETVQDLVVPVGWTHTDATAGVRETTVWANTASDGSADGAWEQIGRSSDPNEPGFNWDTGTREGGLYRFRAQACDRADNCRQREWQAQMLPPDARAESASAAQAGDIRAQKTRCSGPKGNKRCYAGEFVGRRINGEQDPFSRTWGIGADIRTPVPVRHTGRYDFSSAWVGLGGYYKANGTLQSGITTNPGCGRRDRIIDGKRYDLYSRRVEYVDPYGEAFLKCYKPPLDTGEEHRYTVDVVKTTSCAKALIDGTPKLVVVPDHDRRCGRKNRRRYWLNKNGHANTQAMGEVNDPGRQMGGRFFNVLFQPFETTGWQSPTAANVFAIQDTGYMFRGSPDAFCVSDKPRKLCGD